MQIRPWIIAAWILGATLLISECLYLWDIPPLNSETAIKIWGCLLLLWAFVVVRAVRSARWRWAWLLLSPFAALLPAAIFMATRPG